MKYIDIDKPHKHNVKQGSLPLEEHFETLIKEDTIIRVGGVVKLLYLTNRKEFNEMLQVCESMKYDESTRARGLVTNSRIFGYARRNTMRKLPCRETKTLKEYKAQHKKLEEMGHILCGFYKLYNPELYANHAEMTHKNIRYGYALPDGVFTSGIINQNNALRYHYDSGNYSNVWSGMITVRSETEGGYLSIPEYKIGIELSDKSVLFFDGQNVMHGVTPIKKLKPKAKRYTIVYYSLQQLWRCLPIKEEIAFISLL